MTSRTPFVLAIIGAVAAAVFAVWLLEPHVDRLSYTLGVGFVEGAATPETTRFAADLQRLFGPGAFVALIALLVVLAGGLPLAAIALTVQHFPSLFGPLTRNVTVIWLCLTLQMTNVALPSFFILLFSSDGLDAEAVIAILVTMLYAVPNFAAATVWRELLNRRQASRLARVTSAAI
jgi:hypothetical protein